jgi:hypothetical protein
VADGKGAKDGFFGTRHKLSLRHGHGLPGTLTGYSGKVIKNGHFELMQEKETTRNKGPI